MPNETENNKNQKEEKYINSTFDNLISLPDNAIFSPTKVDFFVYFADILFPRRNSSDKIIC